MIPSLSPDPTGALLAAGLLFLLATLTRLLAARRMEIAR